MIRVYTDGGLCSDGNPSVYGGAWGYRVVWEPMENGKPKEGETLIYSTITGIITPAELKKPSVSNNYVELLAVCKGVQHLMTLDPIPPKVWICADSAYGLDIFFGHKKFSSLPPLIHQELKTSRLLVNERLASGAEFTLLKTLLKGHPSPAELEKGYHTTSDGDTRRVSLHNIAVDEACTAACAKINPMTLKELNEIQTDTLFTVGEILQMKRPKASVKT